MPEMDCGVWDRKEWQQERAKYKVPKGVHKASIGDALDKFHKARKGKKIPALIPLAGQLQTTVLAYVAALDKAKKPGYADFAKKIRSDLLVSISAYMKTADDLAKSAPDYKKAYTAMALQVQKLGHDMMAQQKQGQALIRASDRKKLIESLNDYALAVERSTYGSAKLQRSDAAKFQRYAFDFSQQDTYSPDDIDRLLTDAKRVPGSLDV